MKNKTSRKTAPLVLISGLIILAALHEWTAMLALVIGAVVGALIVHTDRE